MEPPSPLPWLFGAWLLRAKVCLVAVSGLLAGCAGDGGTMEETDAVAGAGGGAAIPEGYPEGPYGADVGETIPNLAWRGFVEDDGAGLATDTSYVDTSLDDARRSGARWALLHFGAVF